MNVLLLFPMADGQTGPAIQHAFEQLGHRVKAIDAKRQPGESYKAACEFKPDLVFCSRTAILAGRVVRIKERFKNAIACTWQVDARADINYWKHLFPLIRACDYYFVVASRLIPEWRKLNPNTFWLPQGLQDDIYNKPKELTDRDRQKYECDVCWAGHRGGVHEFREDFLDAISNMGITFKQWGCSGNPLIYNEEHNKMVTLSKINLGMSAFPENEKFISVRDYKILGAGGFLLEFYRNGIYGIFPTDILDCYKTPEELTAKIKYWLVHERERKEVAERGYRWVHENATYTHRIQVALEYMKDRL